MKKATKVSRTSILIEVAVLAAIAIGFYGFTQNVRVPTSDESQVHIQKPQVVKIQKPVLPTVVRSVESKHYLVKQGDSYFSIAQKFKPKNVDMQDYLQLLKNVNCNADLHASQQILIPNEEDLKSIQLPDIVILFDYNDIDIIEHLKNAEGSQEFQSKNKRSLLGGSYGYSFRNNKFYPYRDTKGNYTIGYGHYLGKRDSDAMKYRHGISSTAAHNLLLSDMKETYDDFQTLLQKRNAVNLSKEQQRILYEMSFTMGSDKLNRFNQLWKSVEHQNDVKFKKEIKRSLWYRQVGDRADILLSSL